MNTPSSSTRSSLFIKIKKRHEKDLLKNKYLLKNKRKHKMINYRHSQYKLLKNKQIKPNNYQEDILNDLFSITDSCLSSDEEDLKEKENQEGKRLPQIIKGRILPHLATYLIDHPNDPPENYFYKHYHRLTEQDLLYPIEYITNLPPFVSYNFINHGLIEGVYITMNEFEALQGFSRFKLGD